MQSDISQRAQIMLHRLMCARTRFESRSPNAYARTYHIPAARNSCAHSSNPLFAANAEGKNACRRLSSCSSVRPSISASSCALFAFTAPLTRLRRRTMGGTAAGAEPLPLRTDPLRKVPLRLGAASINSPASAGASGSLSSVGSLSTKPTLGPRLGPLLSFLLPARTA